MKPLTPSLQKYLLVIYELQRKNQHVYQIDIAILLGYSKASVSRAIHILYNKGYIQNHKDIDFTFLGQQEAHRLYQNYEFFYRILRQHAFTQQEAQYYAMQLITYVDDTFLKKINHYHLTHHINI